MVRITAHAAFGLLLLLFASTRVLCQGVIWSNDGNGFFEVEQNEIVRYELPTAKRSVVVGRELLKPENKPPLTIRDFAFSANQDKVVIYTNSKLVWRLDTEGDYWVLDLQTKKLVQVGANHPPSSLRFAKLSPDGGMVAFVSGYNLYMQELASGKETAITKDGNRKFINGTFDWVYEEELACRDGFQWSPDGTRIAFWQVDARPTRDYYMLNTTDSVYSRVIPVEYPKAGQSPSAVRIGVFNLKGGNTTWLNIPGDPAQHYLPRMEWNSPKELYVQQLNRKQNESKIFNCNVATNKVNLVFEEHDDAWIDVYSPWEDPYSLTYRHRIHWLNGNREFLWLSEKDGWRHIYRIEKDGRETLVTKGNFDVLNLVLADEKTNTVYFHASPENATQQYLYKTRLDGSGTPQRVTPAGLEGTHEYSISPNGKFATHLFQNHYTKPCYELVEMPLHRPLTRENSIEAQLTLHEEEEKLEFFKVKIADGTEMDGWMIKPTNFDPSKKYPVLFYVYTEPWGANVKDIYGIGSNGRYKGSLADDGYIYMSIDNRGTPAPKGRAWRKSIYRKIGRLNISDQAMAALEILKWPFIDSSRIAVWGHSGGGSATLNLMFQYPDIYKTGIAGAAVANQFTYDNLYQERYMGLPQENPEDFVAGSPITHAKGLKGNLLYYHGTGDDNVHYDNAEMLINELVKYNKQFQLMSYPNRSHGLREGQGTMEHLRTLFTGFLQKHCPPGGR